MDVRPRELSEAPPVDLIVDPPYRLDLTVAILRRGEDGAVDAWDGDVYVRLFAGAPRPRGYRARQTAPDRIAIEPFGSVDGGASELASAARTFGVPRPGRFHAAAAAVPWLGPLAARMDGARLPRYPSLWEAFVNAVVFQQVSLAAASAILRRTIHALEPAVAVGDAALRAFPAPERWLAASPELLRTAGLSRAKIVSLARLAELLLAGAIDEAELEALPTPLAADRLVGLPGVGAWTAAIVLLRGLGRLDQFPGGDSGIARGLATLGVPPADFERALIALGDERGMLYVTLLLARLDRLRPFRPG